MSSMTGMEAPAPPRSRGVRVAQLCINLAECYPQVFQPSATGATIDTLGEVRTLPIEVDVSSEVPFLDCDPVVSVHSVAVAFCC